MEVIIHLLFVYALLTLFVFAILLLIVGIVKYAGFLIVENRNKQNVLSELIGTLRYIGAVNIGSQILFLRILLAAAIISFIIVILIGLAG